MNKKHLFWLLIPATAIAIACGTGGGPSEGYQPGQSPSPGSTEPAAKDGTFKVPSEIKPGNYVSTVPKDSWGCYYARLNDTEGGPNSIIANNLAQSGQRVRVTILESDSFFETRGCGAWRVEQ